MRRLKIGLRLALSFALIILLMFLGTAVGLWQFNTMRVQAQRLHQADNEVAAILRVHNGILLLKSELQELIEARDPLRFASEATALRNNFIKQVGQATRVLSRAETGEPPDDEQLSQLRAIRTSLSAQIDSMIDLAVATDWLAVQLRLDNQVQQVSQITEELVEDISGQVMKNQQQAQENMRQAQWQALITVLITGFLTLLVAGWSGFIVTRSIAQPLTRLDAGARALAQGEFQHEILVTGDDELSNLSRAFNHASSQLANRYADLEEMVRRRTEELHHRAIQLKTSVAVGQRITSILELDSLLNQVAELIKEQYGYYYVGVFLLDEDGAYVTARAGTGEAGRSLCQEGFRLQVGQEGIIGWVAGNRQLALVDDVAQDSRYMVVANMPDTRSELALPLEMGGKLLGVLDIQSERVRAFHEDDVPVLQSLAGQVATAIQNAFLYQSEKTRRQLAETLYEIGRALSGTLNLAEVLDLILEHLADTVAYDRAAILLQNRDELEMVAARGFPANVQPQQLRVSIREDDVFQKIYRAQQPLAIPDVLLRPDWQHQKDLPLARAWLGVPLIRFDHVIGMLSLTREVPNAYGNDEVKLAATFAGQAAIALENARLYDKITRFTQELEGMVRERTEAVREAYDQLERLDRTKSDFIRIAAHELRTPLTVLRGYSKMLLNEAIIKENAHHAELVTGIHSGSVRLQEIVTSMLDIAKIDTRVLELYPEPLSIPSVIELVSQTLVEPLAERKQLLKIADMSHLPYIEADPDALYKVFHHLIINAIKYTPNGGTITISGRSLTDNGQPASGIEIVISDTGIGIDPRFHELIFTKFYQTGELALHSSGKTNFKGAGPGLGLTIARGIVEAHQGKIWVESSGYDETICPGSQFHVVLPLRQRN